jgi:signal transduction histidine kinase
MAVPDIPARVSRSLQAFALLGGCLLLAMGLCAAGDGSRFSPAADRSWQLQGFAEEAGLQHQRVFDVDFGADGSVWLAASSGLYQFDGYRWTRRGRENGLPSDYVRCVCITRAGLLWVGTTDGVGLYDPVHERFASLDTAAHLPNSNVRAIREEQDGSLWFSCDQWPDTSVAPGGLAVRGRDGSWRSYSQADGLPMNYSIGSFRDAEGVDWAFSPQGWARLVAGRWEAQTDPLALAEPMVGEMANGRDGELIAIGEGSSLIRRDGRWSLLPSRLSVATQTRRGEVFALEYDKSKSWFWFSQWDGRTFTAASARLPTHPQSRFYKLREAPDGSIWAVGYAAVIRWQRFAGLVQYFPGVPRPQFTDRQGRTWFAGNDQVAWSDAAGFHSLEDLSDLTGVDLDGAVVGRDAATHAPVLLRTDAPGRLEPLGLGISQVSHAETDDQGRLWLAGRGADGRWLIVSRGNDAPIRVVLPAEGIMRIHNMHGLPGGGVSLCLFSPGDMGYRLAKVGPTGDFAWIDAGPDRPALPYPNYTWVGDEEWIIGHTSLFVRKNSGGQPWQRLFEDKAWGFGQILAGAEESAVLFLGGPGVRAGCLLRRGAEWSVHYGDFYQAALSTDRRRLYMMGPGGIHVRRTGTEGGFAFIPLPGDAVAQSVVEAADGTLWVGVPDGTLHVQARSRPPVALVSAPVQELGVGAGLPVSFSGIQYMDTKADARAFRYAWALDGAPFGSFQSGGGRLISTSHLAPGSHELRVVAQDAYGNRAAEPALLRFDVHPVPIQERSWFYFGVVGICLVILCLLLWGAVRTRQIARANAALLRENAHRRRVEAALEAARGGLEREVDERTRELQEANIALRREMVDRLHAEASKRELEDQLRQSQKLQAIGTLAGGIAHDFNNILAIILPNLHFALEEYGSESQLREYLQPARQAAERARELVDQILTFSRQESRSRRETDLVACVREACKLIRSSLPAGISLELALETGTPSVLADETQLHQVLMNLCTNARHAMGEQGGRIRVTLSPVNLSETEAATLSGLRPGPHALLCVSDNGCGIPPELMGRIFEPFFTTKQPGKGTGLGLSVVHGIVREHEGAIRVESRIGEGTRFSLYFPALGGPPAVVV